jgi:hypothetical protein
MIKFFRYSTIDRTIIRIRDYTHIFNNNKKKPATTLLILIFLKSL